MSLLAFRSEPLPLRWRAKAGRYDAKLRGRSRLVRRTQSHSARIRLLPADELRRLAGKIDVPLSQIHAVASFYPTFSSLLRPNDVRVCADIVCHLRGGVEVKASLDRAAFRGANPEAVTIRDVSCLGRCDQAPAISVNEADLLQCARAERAAAVIKDTADRWRASPDITEIKPGPVGSDPYNGSSTIRVVQAFVETREWAGVIATLKASGLRGMGGAGFPTGSKWEIVRNAAGEREIHRL